MNYAVCIVLLATLALTACAKDSPQPESTATAEQTTAGKTHAEGPTTSVPSGKPTSPTSQTPDLSAPAAAPSKHGVMALQYEQAHAMKLAVIGGDLDRFRLAAKQLAEQPLPADAPKDWQQDLSRMQLAARVGVGAVDVQAAATALSRLGQTCADCHTKRGGPKLPALDPPSEKASVAAHMARHQWAADTMWDGLIGPSEQAWVKGADAMAVAPLHRDTVAPQTPGLDDIARSVHQKANEARRVPSQGRASAYAALLATCATCHDMTGVTKREQQ
jgi:mono/diheme cytochrome c family protein